MLMTLRLNGCCRLLPALQVLLRSRSRVLQNIFTPRDTRWRAPPIMSATSGFLMRNMADRTNVVKGKSVSVRVDLGGRRSIQVIIVRALEVCTDVSCYSGHTYSLCINTNN